MSKELQTKLYNYEVPPPSTTWEQISSALDESYLSEKFPSRLHNAEIAPPPSAWASIASALENESAVAQYPVTLYNLEATPPFSAWEKIKAGLEEKDLPVIPMRRRAVPFIRYAAAAAIIGALVLAGISIFNNKTANDTGIANTSSKAPITNPVQTPAENNNTSSSEETAVISDEARNDAALEESKKTFASLDSKERQRMKKVSDEFFQTSADPIVISANFNPTSVFEELECTDVAASYAGGNSPINMANRYAMLITPDGHMIRISRKLGELVCCVSGEDQADECMDQMKKWRKKIANSPVTPSPGNFMDIVDLIQTLKDTGL